MSKDLTENVGANPAMHVMAPSFSLSVLCQQEVNYG